MSRAGRRWSWLTAVAVVAVALVVNPAARADNRGSAAGPTTVIVGDETFKDDFIQVLVNEPVTFVLDDAAQLKHSVSFGDPPNPTAPRRYILDPADPNARKVTVTFDRPGNRYYHCTFHPHHGIVTVRDPLTATTAAPAPTTTTTRLAPTTTTTKRPVVTAPPSAAPAGVVSASKATTTTSAAPAIAPLTAPSSGAATSAIADTKSPDAEAAADAEEVTFEEASLQEEAGDETSSKALLIVAIGLAALVLGAGGWRWYHRSSRYQPA